MSATTDTTATTDQLRTRLAKRLPAHCILSDPESLRPFECDAFTAARKLPMMVVIPETIEDICHVMRTCHQLAVPVVARGAGTGLSGGALPHDQGVLLVLSKFNRILEIDAANRCARVEPGVRNLAISEAVAHLGLYFAPDPSSQIASSIGGNVAENAGGVHCLKYGLTVHNILGLQLVTAEGELVTIGGKTLDTPGFDLLALLTGSEGMLGVIVEVTVKLLPTPDRASVILAAFGTLEQAGQAVNAVITEGMTPAGLEMVDQATICAIEELLHAGFPTDAAAILLCEVDGSDADVKTQLEQAKSILGRAGATQLRVSGDEAERQFLWKARKAAFPALARLAPDTLVMDGTIPRKHLAPVLSEITRLAESTGLRVLNAFHAGDGNIHPTILFDATQPGELARVEALSGRILDICIKAGGTISGEHGIGIEKIDHMCSQFQPAELEQFHALKYAFDPQGLLNPGKLIPTLARCAEFGALHVRNGQFPFPDLERF